MEGHLSGQASWMASGALETGASESGYRQKEGQLTVLFPSWWGVTERLRVSSVARQSCPRGGGDSARPPAVLLRCLQASLSRSVKWGQRPLSVPGGSPGFGFPRGTRQGFEPWWQGKGPPCPGLLQLSQFQVQSHRAFSRQQPGGGAAKL